MRLLDAEPFQFTEFFDNEVPRYAILSQTWREGEVSFKDFDRNNAEAAHEAGWIKIKKTCQTALQDGLHWAWIDTCSIEKSSSAELSEAINSMFRWYEKAEVCYAFLDDVPAGCHIANEKSLFANARWFKRDRTLQELIAPAKMKLYAPDLSTTGWVLFGSKQDLQEIVPTVTGVPLACLVMGELGKSSVAQRMSWASQRETTRDEATAYCLLGIFDANMPLLYGEGHKAFIRLQEEIMKRSNDQSLFAWGISVSSTSQRTRWLPEQSALDIPDEHWEGPYQSTGSFLLLIPMRQAMCEATEMGLRIYTALITALITPFETMVRWQFEQEKYDIVYATIECYDTNVLDKIVIPVVRWRDGRYYRLLPLNIFSRSIRSINVPTLSISSTSPCRHRRSEVLMSRHATSMNPRFFNLTYMHEDPSRLLRDGQPKLVLRYLGPVLREVCPPGMLEGAYLHMLRDSGEDDSSLTLAFTCKGRWETLLVHLTLALAEYPLAQPANVECRMDIRRQPAQHIDFWLLTDSGQ